MILGHQLHIGTEVHSLGGNFPGIAAAIAVDPEGASLVGAGKADVFVSCFEEMDIAKAEGFEMLSQLA